MFLPKSIGRCWLVLFCLLALLPVKARAAADSKEYQIKAAFLLNFTKFVEWQPAAFASSTEPFNIGILGDDPFGPILDQTIQGETAKNRKIVILRSKHLDDLKNCHLLFISKSEKSRVTEILSGLEAKPVLKVSEIDAFAMKGGNINFYFDKTKVRFEINPAAAQRCGLKISSELLSVAKIVGKEGK
jgi:hypothetical protein